VHFHSSMARVTCPTHCQKDPASVAFGASIHPMRSSVCLAAIVDNVMPVYGGELLVTKVPGLESYTGKDVNYAASLGATGEKGEAFHVYASNTIDLGPTFPFEEHVDCTRSFASLGMKRVGGSQPVRCPGNCQHLGSLAGTSIYTPGSSVCRASEHAGVLGTEGGHVMVTLGHGQDEYFGSTVRGDPSIDAPKSNQSYTVARPTSDVLSRVSLSRESFL